jgi:hypothetical protein
MEYSFSRRDVLRYGATAGGVGVVGALSGCSAIGGLLGDGADPSYPEWLAAPDEITDDEHYTFTYENIGEIRDAEPEFNDTVSDNYADRDAFDEFDIDPDDVDEVVTLRPISDFLTPTVISGSFGKEDVTDTIDDADREFSEDEAVGEYTLYSAEGDAAVAVKEGTVIFGEVSADDVEAVIDSKNGEADRYVDVNEDMDALVDEIGGGTFAFGSTMDTVEETDAEGAQFEGQVAFGYSDTVDGESTDTEIAVLFDTADDVDMEAIEDYTEGDVFDNYDDLSSSRDGRIVTITGTVDTVDLYT